MLPKQPINLIIHYIISYQNFEKFSHHNLIPPDMTFIYRIVW